MFHTLGNSSFWEMEKGLRLFDLFAKLLSYSQSVHIDFSPSQQKTNSDSSPYLSLSGSHGLGEGHGKEPLREAGRGREGLLKAGDLRVPW